MALIESVQPASRSAQDSRPAPDPRPAQLTELCPNPGSRHYNRLRLRRTVTRCSGVATALLSRHVNELQGKNSILTLKSSPAPGTHNTLYGHKFDTANCVRTRSRWQ